MAVPTTFESQFKAYITSRQFVNELKARNLRLRLLPPLRIWRNVVPIYRKVWQQISGKRVIEIELKPLNDSHDGSGTRQHLAGKIIVRQKHPDSIWEVKARKIARHLQDAYQGRFKGTPAQIELEVVRKSNRSYRRPAVRN